MVSVVEAVQRDLELLGPKAAETTLAATALTLAAELDAGNSATSKSMCAKALVDVMGELRALSPPVKEADPVDELRKQRAKRRSGRASAS